MHLPPNTCGPSEEQPPSGDMLMLGYIVLKALWIYVEINDIMRSQADILIQARHGVLLSLV